MDSVTGAALAAAVAWASIVLAAFLPIPQAAFARLRWVGAASIALVAFALVGVAVPGWAPLAVLVGGGALALGWPARRPRPRPPVGDGSAAALPVASGQGGSGKA